MKALKGNKVYNIAESEKGNYKKQGFDIVNDEGEVIEYGAGKTVSHEEHEKLKEAYAALQKENEELKLSAMTVDQLKAYATEKKVDLGDASTKDAILAKFKETVAK
jgi:hypothetical protein